MILKGKTKLFNFAVFILLMMFYSSTSFADWVNDWFDKAVIDASSSYQNQQRGFYTAGGFSARLNTANDHLITVSKPKLESGCGGIDLFLGGISFLDSDYMVDKLQSMMHAAPLIGFDMAMKTMCKECSETLFKADSAINWLNGLQFNECAMSRRMVTTVANHDPNILGAVWNEMSSGESLKSSLNRNWQEAQEKIRSHNNEPQIDLKSKVEGCPSEFKEIFKAGSVIEHATSKMGMTNYADIIRGYMGDVEIYGSNEDKIPSAIEILPCSQNHNTSIDDMLLGKAYAKGIDGKCYIDTTKGVLDIIRERLSNIAKHMKSQTPLTPEEDKLIIATPNIPIYSILRKAIIKNTLDAQIENMAELVAINYTWYILNDLYRNTDFMFKRIQSIANGTGKDNKCDVRVYAQALSHFDNLHNKLRENRKSMSASFQQKMESYMLALQFQQMHEQDDKNYKSRNMLDYGK